MTLELLATIAALCNAQARETNWHVLHDRQVTCQKDYISCVALKQSERPKASEGVLLAACVKEQ